MDWGEIAKAGGYSFVGGLVAAFAFQRTWRKEIEAGQRELWRKYIENNLEDLRRAAFRARLREDMPEELIPGRCGHCGARFPLSAASSHVCKEKGMKWAK